MRTGAKRGTLNFLLDLARAETDCDTSAFIYLAALVANKGRGSNIYAEFEKRTALLFEAADVGTQLHRMRPLASALFDRLEPNQTTDSRCTDWLTRIRGGRWYPASAVDDAG
jgi:hypothetical protein